MHGYGDQVEPTQEGSTERIKQESLATKAYTQRGLVVKAEGSWSIGCGFKSQFHYLQYGKPTTMRYLIQLIFYEYYDVLIHLLGNQQQ